MANNGSGNIYVKASRLPVSFKKDRFAFGMSYRYKKSKNHMQLTVTGVAEKLTRALIITIIRSLIDY